MRRLLAAEQNIRCGLLWRADAQRPQLRQVRQPGLPPRFEDMLDIFGANPRNAQQFRPAGPHNLQRRMAQVTIRPCLLGIEVHGQVAILLKGQILHFPGIIPQQETGLIQAEFTLCRHSGEILERRINYRAEGRVIGPLQPYAAVELRAQRQEFQVGIPHCANHKLRHQACQPLPAFLPGLAADLAGPAQAFQQFRAQVLLRGQGLQTRLSRCFQVERNAVCQLHGPQDLILFCAGHDLEVNITTIRIALADDFHYVDDFVLGDDAPLDNPRRQEQPINHPSALHLIKHAGQFIGLKGNTPYLAASRPEGAVVAVLFAGCCDHRFEDGLAALWGGEMRDAFCKALRLVRDARMALGKWRIARRFKERYIAHLSEFLRGVRFCVDYHTAYYTNMCSWCQGECGLRAFILEGARIFVLVLYNTRCTILSVTGRDGRSLLMAEDNNQLKALRAQIDPINMQILELLNKRAAIAREIGRVQSELGTRFYDPVREAEMLQALEQANNGPFSNETIKHLFREIFRATLAMEEADARMKILVQRKTSDEKTIITLPDGTQIGNSVFQVIAGPCAVESLEQMDIVAAALAERGVRVIRGMGYKPRTSPYDFQGLGEAGLQIARLIANKYQMYVTSEIMDQSQIPVMSDYVDIFWVGARNMQNSFLLRALGKVKQPVILKRHFSATLKELLYAAEYIVASGNPNVILMERGVRTFEQWTRNTLDISAVPLLKQETHLPVIVDVSHSAGRRDIACPLAKAAKAVGADGLMVEVHPNPPVAMSDAKQQLSIPEFHALMDALEELHVAAPVTQP